MLPFGKHRLPTSLVLLLTTIKLHAARRTKSCDQLICLVHRGSRGISILLQGCLHCNSLQMHHWWCMSKTSSSLDFISSSSASRTASSDSAAATLRSAKSSSVCDLSSAVWVIQSTERQSLDLLRLDPDCNIVVLSHSTSPFAQTSRRARALTDLIHTSRSTPYGARCTFS